MKGFVFNLPNTINELKEDGTSICVIVLVIPVSSTLSKLVPKAQPLFFDQNLLAWKY